MDKRLVILAAITGLGMTFLSFPDGALSVLLILAIMIPAVFIMQKFPEKKDFLINIFLLGLLLRIWLGIVIHIFDLRDVFGPDAFTYDQLGQRLYEIWMGDNVPNDLGTVYATNPNHVGWGMIRLVAIIYTIFGQSILVAQSFCAVFGALTAPMVYVCAEKIFSNKRVSTYSALTVAVFPSFVIWSSQLLKDGLIVFLLVCTMVLVLQLAEKDELFLCGFVNNFGFRCLCNAILYFLYAGSFYRRKLFHRFGKHRQDDGQKHYYCSNFGSWL